MCDWLHAGKTAHSAAADEVHVGSFETGMLASGIRIEVNNQKWSLDWKVVYKLRRLAVKGVWIARNQDTRDTCALHKRTFLASNSVGGVDAASGMRLDAHRWDSRGRQ